MPPTRICSHCHKAKPLSEFCTSSKERSGYIYWCKTCCKQATRAKYDYERARAEQLKCNYRITPQEYEQLYQQQAGVCAACGQPERRRAGRKKRTENVTPSLHIDYGHKTGIMRGLLYSGCNTALGSLDEDPERIKALLKYVEERVVPHG